MRSRQPASSVCGHSSSASPAAHRRRIESAEPMTFYEVLAQTVELLQREGRVSYRALKRRFSIDDEYLEDLKAEIIRAKRRATDEDGAVLVWTGSALPSPTSSGPHAPETGASGSAPATISDEGERRQLTVM